MVRYLNIAQTKAELEKCLHCAAKPCMKACPVGVSPCDFIAAAKDGSWDLAAEVIYQQNPMGEICGLICPDTFCMKACVRANVDAPIRIPPLQALIMQKARLHNVAFKEDCASPNGKKVAVIGAGPAGFGAITVLLRKGYSVKVFEKENVVGGALNLIPSERLPREIITYEWRRLVQNSLLQVEFGMEITDYAALLNDGFDGIVVATGAQNFRMLGIEGEENALPYTQYLSNPQKYATDGNVAIIGGGAVAVDCAITAKKQGANHVEMFVRRRFGDMRITAAERQELLEQGIDITTMTRLTKIEKKSEKLTAYTVKTEFNDEGRLQDIAETLVPRANFSHIILALGSNGNSIKENDERIVYAGDVLNGGTTAVQAIASGKAAAEKLMAELTR